MSDKLKNAPGKCKNWEICPCYEYGYTLSEISAILNENCNKFFGTDPNGGQQKSPAEPDCETH
ncbi:MAG: hypothetical protein LBR54_05060 [Oscillospiraceae bacterium]|jgi:hypothetical protein|nr:hypothetical protein [Oscillospiraceae bacterium]